MIMILLNYNHGVRTCQALHNKVLIISTVQHSFPLMGFLGYS